MAPEDSFLMTPDEFDARLDDRRMAPDRDHH